MYVASPPFDALSSDRPLIVYIDYKSPYAFVAKDPVYRLEDEFGIEIDWRPLTLDIPSYLGSARLDDTGKVAASNRSEAQWASVRYAYRDARRYAALTGLTLRGTTKIWDTSLAHIGMLWASNHGHDVLKRYTNLVYGPFWRRELDLEDAGVVAALLRAAGADMAGFDAYASGAGRTQHDAMQRAVFDAGIFGVPTFVIDGEVFFGREHLPVVRWQLGGRHGAAPDIAYERGGISRQASGRSQPDTALRIAIDFNNPHGYLALQPTWALIDALDVAAEWLPHLPAPARPAATATVSTRGGRHRAMRAAYRDFELGRSARTRGLRIVDAGRRDDPVLAASALLWTNRKAPQCVRQYLECVFAARFEDGANLAAASTIHAALQRAGVGQDGFDAFAAGGAAATELGAVQQRLQPFGVTGAPSYVLGDEVFHGREHLPMLHWLLDGRDGPPPI